MCPPYDFLSIVLTFWILTRLRLSNAVRHQLAYYVLETGSIDVMSAIVTQEGFYSWGTLRKIRPLCDSKRKQGIEVLATSFIPNIYIAPLKEIYSQSSYSQREMP